MRRSKVLQQTSPCDRNLNLSARAEIGDGSGFDSSIAEAAAFQSRGGSAKRSAEDELFGSEEAVALQSKGGRNIEIGWVWAVWVCGLEMSCDTM